MIARALRAFALATSAWLAGLALAVGVGFAAGLSLPGPSGIVAGGLVLGAIVGLAQKRITNVAGPRIVVVTALAIPPAFLATAFLGSTLHLAGLTALAGPLVVATQVALGHSGGNGPRASLGPAGAAALGWMAAIGGLVVPGVPVGVRAVALLLPGTMAAIYVVVSRRSRARTQGALGIA